MKIITRLMHDRESFESEYLKSAEDFVGEFHDYNYEIGIDDQYTIFYYSSDVPEVIIDWVFDNRYMIWHLLDKGVEFNSFSALVDKLNADGIEWDDDSWALLTINE